MAPFFLPTVSDVNGFKFDMTQALDDANQAKSKISKLVSISMFLSDFANAIMKSETDGDCKKFI